MRAGASPASLSYVFEQQIVDLDVKNQNEHSYTICLKQGRRQRSGIDTIKYHT